MPTTFSSVRARSVLAVPALTPRLGCPKAIWPFFIADSVAALDLQALDAVYERDGRRNQPFDPQMMVTVLLSALSDGHVFVAADCAEAGRGCRVSGLSGGQLAGDTSKRALLAGTALPERAEVERTVKQLSPTASKL